MSGRSDAGAWQRRAQLTLRRSRRYQLADIGGAFQFPCRRLISSVAAAYRPPPSCPPHDPSPERRPPPAAPVRSGLRRAVSDRGTPVFICFAGVLGARPSGGDAARTRCPAPSQRQLYRIKQLGPRRTWLLPWFKMGSRTKCGFLCWGRAGRITHKITFNRTFCDKVPPFFLQQRIKTATSAGTIQTF